MSSVSLKEELGIVNGALEIHAHIQEKEGCKDRKRRTTTTITSTCYYHPATTRGIAAPEKKRSSVRLTISGTGRTRSEEKNSGYRRSNLTRSSRDGHAHMLSRLILFPRAHACRLAPEVGSEGLQLGIESNSNEQWVFKF